jgi:hypothetical protein
VSMLQVIVNFETAIFVTVTDSDVCFSIHIA